jgi:cell shape-determining protein MreC
MLSRRRVAALLVLTCMLLITLDRNGNPVIDRLRRGFGAVTRPFENAATAVALPIKNAWHGVVDYDDVVRERDALRDQVVRQRGAEIENETAALEYYDLLELNRLTSAGQFNYEAARVIGDAAGNFQNTIEIDKGSNSGIAVGMPVTDGEGLVGKITKVSPDRSIVMLLTDPNYGVQAAVFTGEVPPIVATEQPTDPTTPSGRPEDDLGAAPPDDTSPSGDQLDGTTPDTAPPDDAIPDVVDTTSTSSTVPPDVSGAPSSTEGVTTTTALDVDVIRETGTLTGNGGGQPIQFRFVDDNVTLTEVKVGSPVKTAGGSKSNAPPGIPIGEVTAIKRQTGSRSPLVEVTPYAQLKQLNFVAVVLYIVPPES